MVTKDSSFNEKVEYLRKNILDSNTEDNIAILNIVNLVGMTNLCDELFETDNILFKDLEEFSDIKTELKEDLSKLKLELSKYYLSTITSCRSIVYANSKDIVAIPNLYRVIMVNIGLFSLNNILSKNIKLLNLNELVVVDDAIQLFRSISNPLFILDNIVLDLYKEEQ